MTAAIADLAEAAIRALCTPPERPLWELRGPAWTFAQLAEAIAVYRGHPVALTEVTDAEMGAFAVLYPLIRRGVFAEETSDLAELLGRAPRTLSELIAETAAGSSRPHTAR